MRGCFGGCWVRIEVGLLEYEGRDGDEEHDAYDVNEAFLAGVGW